jgi:hypothetical protein
MKRVQMVGGMIPAAAGLVLGVHAAPQGQHAAAQYTAPHEAGQAGPAASQASPLTGRKCWTINAANIRMFEQPDKSPFLTTKKGQEFVTSGSPAEAGGKEWYFGSDRAYLSPPFGWIARNYLNKRTC